MLQKKQATSFHHPHHHSKAANKQPATNASNVVAKPVASAAVATKRPRFVIQIPDQPAEIRRDYLYDEYAIIAPKRHGRPFDFRGSDHPLIETASSPHLDEQTLIDELKSPLGGWPVRVVDNKFPALTLTNPKAYGEQEIIVDTPLSNLPTGHLSLEAMQDVLTMYQQRITSLYKKPHIQYVQVFKNDGHHAGASLAHAHTQVFALPLVPPRFADHAKVVEAYLDEKQSDPYEDIINYELKEGLRVISDSPELLAFSPYASCWPLEAWLMPKRAMQSFRDCSASDIKAIAKALLPLLRKLTDCELNYNFFIEEGVSSKQRWVLKIYGRDVVSPQGGLEVATGIMINTIPPEAAAAWYKA